MQAGDVWRSSSRSGLPRCVQVRRHGKRTAKPQLLVWRRHQALTDSGGSSSNAADREALQPSVGWERCDAVTPRKRPCKVGQKTHARMIAALAGARAFVRRLRKLHIASDRGFLCCLTFELSCPRRQTALGRGRDDAIGPWSGQATAAVAGQLERGVRRHLVTTVVAGFPASKSSIQQVDFSFFNSPFTA